MPVGEKEPAMPLAGYGILYGTVVSVRAPRSDESHWLLLVQPLDRRHPVYRVAIEIAGAKVGIQGQWCNLRKGGPGARATAKGLTATFASPGAPGSFLTLQDSAKNQTVAGLDYMRSGVVDLAAFVAIGNA